jgi:hypothetical protein
MAYSVTERQRKIELLMALAADAFDVRRLVLPEGMTPVGIGRAIGLARSLAVSPVVATLLYGVSPPDIVTFGGVSGLLAALAPLASYLPPRSGRALSIRFRRADQQSSNTSAITNPPSCFPARADLVRGSGIADWWTNPSPRHPTGRASHTSTPGTRGG